MKNLKSHLNLLKTNKIFIGSFIYSILFGILILSLNINSLVTSDGLSQYTAIIHNSISNIISGNWYKLIYDSTLGLGQPFINVFIYYGMSPFNLLLLIPYVTMTHIIIIKVIVLSIVVNYVFAKKFKTLSLIEHLFFTLTFLISNAVMVNILNFIWLDSIIGLTLLVYIIDSKIKHQKLIIFIITSYMIWSNFYLSIILLLFVGIYTIFERKFKISLVLILAGIINLAPIILGSYQNLITRNILPQDPIPLFNSTKEYLTTLLQLLSSSGPGIEALTRYMNTTIHLGIYSLFLIIAVYLCIKAYKSHKVWIIGIMMLSLISPKINAVFHGGQLPSGWDYRFSPLLVLFVLFIFAETVCNNKQNNELTFLQLKTIISIKDLWISALIYISIFILSIIGATIFYPAAISDTSQLEYVFTALIICSILIGLILMSKKIYKPILIISFGSIILSFALGLGITYKDVSPELTANNINSIRKSVKIWESKQSNNNLLNKTIRLTGSTPTLNNPKIAQVSAFVTPVSPYLSLDRSIYMVDSSRVKYNTNADNPISNLIYGANFELDTKSHIWKSIDNVDRGFVLDSYYTPKTTSQFVNLMSNDTINIKDSNIVNVKSIGDRIEISLNANAIQSKTYILQFKSQTKKIELTSSIDNYKESETSHGSIILNKNIRYQLKISKKEFKSNISRIYESSKHLSPKQNLKNSFKITSGQNSNQILKGKVNKSGDLVLRILYDKNLKVSVNNHTIKTQRAFNALILIPNVKTNDVITVSYKNPILKPIIIYTLMIYLMVIIGYILWKLLYERILKK